jgi:hypothetical protein
MPPENQDLPTSLPPTIASTNYLTVLARLHGHLNPRTYLEIGTQKGESLRVAKCASLSIDPHFMIDKDVIGNKPKCLFFQTPSDRFFAQNDPKSLLGASVDFAFLDGMHLFEFLLRDFIQVERHCRYNSVIALHDILPTNFRMAERDPRLGEAWTGDVWKTVLILKELRPELQMLALDAGPTGLLLCTNLEPTSMVLEQRFFDLVERYRPLTLEEFGIKKYREALNVQDPSILETFSMIAAHFWL